MTNLTMQIQFKELNYRGRSAAPRAGKFPEETRKGIVAEGKSVSRDGLKEYLNVNTFKGKPFSGVIAHFRYALRGKR